MLFKERFLLLVVKILILSQIIFALSHSIQHFLTVANFVALLKKFVIRIFVVSFKKKFWQANLKPTLESK